MSIKRVIAIITASIVLVLFVKEIIDPIPFETNIKKDFLERLGFDPDVESVWIDSIAILKSDSQVQYLKVEVIRLGNEWPLRSTLLYSISKNDTILIDIEPF